MKRLNLYFASTLLFPTFLFAESDLSLNYRGEDYVCREDGGRNQHNQLDVQIDGRSFRCFQGSSDSGTYTNLRNGWYQSRQSGEKCQLLLKRRNNLVQQLDIKCLKNEPYNGGGYKVYTLNATDLSCAPTGDCTKDSTVVSLYDDSFVVNNTDFTPSRAPRFVGAYPLGNYTWSAGTPGENRYLLEVTSSSPTRMTFKRTGETELSFQCDPLVGHCSYLSGGSSSWRNWFTTLHRNPSTGEYTIMLIKYSPNRRPNLQYNQQ